MDSGRVKSEVAKSFDEDNIDSEGPHPIVSFKEAQEAIQTLRTFLEQQNEADFNLFVKLDDHIKSFSHQMLKQGLVTDYVTT